MQPIFSGTSTGCHLTLVKITLIDLRKKTSPQVLKSIQTYFCVCIKSHSRVAFLHKSAILNVCIHRIQAITHEIPHKMHYSRVNHNQRWIRCTNAEYFSHTEHGYFHFCLNLCDTECIFIFNYLLVSPYALAIKKINDVQCVYHFIINCDSQWTKNGCWMLRSNEIYWVIKWLDDFNAHSSNINWV